MLAEAGSLGLGPPGFFWEGGGGAKSKWGGALSGSAPAPPSHPWLRSYAHWQKVPCIDRPGPGEMRTRHSYLTALLPEQRCASLGLGGGRRGGVGGPERREQNGTVDHSHCV